MRHQTRAHPPASIRGPAPRLVLLLLLALAAGVASAGTPVPVGDEFRVNTYPTGGEWRSDVAADADGDFVVVWDNLGSNGSDSSDRSILGQRFDSAGAPVGDEFQVNTYTLFMQVLPAVAADADGDFVAVWESHGSSGSDSDSTSIQGQRFDSAGAPVGDEFQVNTYTTRGQRYPAVAADADGDFLVVWQSLGSSGSDSDSTSIQGQRFDSTGAPVGDEFQVNTYTTGRQEHEDVACDADGDFVVVWESDRSSGSDSSFSSIQGQRFDSTGAPAGDEFQVNTYTTSYQRNPAVATDADGAFVVVWHDSGRFSVQGQRFDSAGTPVGEEFQVNTTGSGQWPAVAADIDGDFVVVWQSLGSSGSDSRSRSIQGRYFDSAGAPAGDQFQVNTYTPREQIIPAVAADADGAFVVVWHSYFCCGPLDDPRAESGWYSIQGQRFHVDSDGDGLDSDGDGVPDDQDRCPGFDDRLDTDGDEVPDGCDVCAGFDDRLDTDGDGAPNGCDVCPGFDDHSDADGDGVPDGCDPCTAGANLACLLGNRFRIEGLMRDFNSPPRSFGVRVMSFPGGRAETDQSVFFESFSPGNFEIGVKMVDGCGLPEGHPLRNYWAFVGGLTNAETEIIFEDTMTGQRLAWRNPAGHFPQTVGHTSAFPCTVGTPSMPCVRSASTACLLDSRFKITGRMEDFSTPPQEFQVRVMSFAAGRAESDQAVFFESFSPGNFEVGVKIVVGCGLPEGHPLRYYWVFYGGLTNAYTRIEVEQIWTGLIDVWENPAGMFPFSEGRTNAFPCE